MNKTDIEEDINKLNKFCEYEDSVVLVDDKLFDIQYAIENILAELKRLQEENELQRKQLNDAFTKGFIHKDEIKDIQTKANKYDRLLEKIKDRIESIKKCYEKEINKYYDESIGTLNISCLNKKEKQELLNKRNCLIVQKATFKEVLELLDTEK